MIYEPLAGNPLETRADLTRALVHLILPLGRCFSSGSSLVFSGDTGAHYARKSAGFEGFSRPFWGLVPSYAGADFPEELTAYLRQSLEGLRGGIDPSSQHYWGEPADNDQRFVEMAVLGLSLVMCPGLIGDSLAGADRENLVRWLGAVNDHAYPQCNWLFFRVLVNLGLSRISEKDYRTRIGADLDTIDTYYRGDGWYSDGNTGQYDYYISFGMHFYGMLYSVLSEKEDPERGETYRKRAALFARDFLGWFSAGGESLPYGRSLNYRFAQGAFWAAAAFCGLEREAPSSWLTPGVQKGLLLRHLRYWFRQPVFSETGLLTIGYTYPNLNMAENYNSPAGPYWALKSLLVLALPEDSAFWKAEEEPYPVHEVRPLSLQRHPHFLFCRDEESQNVQVLTGGQKADFDPRHSEYKYSKFAYSTLFGFSVPTGIRKLEQQGGDNTLLVSEDGVYWRPRRESFSPVSCESALASDWTPFPTVRIRSVLTWSGLCQLRIHLVHTEHTLHICEGGHACPVEDDTNIMSCNTGGYDCRTEGAGLFSSIFSLEAPQRLRGEFQEFRPEGFLAGASPNSSLLFPRTVIPCLKGVLTPGSWVLFTLVSGGRADSGQGASYLPDRKRENTALASIPPHWFQF